MKKLHVCEGFSLHVRPEGRTRDISWQNIPKCYMTRFNKNPPAKNRLQHGSIFNILLAGLNRQKQDFCVVFQGVVLCI
jgi:hypothetical protein